MYTVNIYNMDGYVHLYMYTHLYKYVMVSTDCWNVENIYQTEEEY